MLGPYLERAQQALIDAHHSARVVELAAVVRRAEQRDQLPFREELVPVLDDLMRAADKIHIMLLQEARNDVRSEGKRYAAVVLAPPCDVLIGIGPKEIAEQPTIRNLETQSATASKGAW